MKKKLLVILIVILVIATLGYSNYSKKYKQTKEDTKNAGITTSNGANKNEVQKNETQNKDEVITGDRIEVGGKDSYPIEDGFLSTIDLSGTKEEIIKNNNLQEDSKIETMGQLKAKNVAENFIQGIATFDIEKPAETMEKATKHAVPELKAEIEALFINLGKHDTIKKNIVVELRSVEKEQDSRNDYLTFMVEVSTDIVDKYDQQVDGTKFKYEVKVLSIGDEWKVVQYYLD